MLVQEVLRWDKSIRNGGGTGALTKACTVCSHSIHIGNSAFVGAGHAREQRSIAGMARSYMFSLRSNLALLRYNKTRLSRWMISASPP
jgi:hypothetical protein